ncbi:MAG TPA: S1C family serine protease, partial [Polyangiaceae bacterium]|nr:S1C family serine protease [Polyangiaceae bacterium]
MTQGVLSRVEMTPYSQSQRVLLAGQIDAAINSRNSGGPVVRGSGLVGVARGDYPEAIGREDE